MQNATRKGCSEGGRTLVQLVCSWLTRAGFWGCSVNIGVVFPILWAFTFPSYLFIKKLECNSLSLRKTQPAMCSELPSLAPVSLLPLLSQHGAAQLPWHLPCV